VTTTNDAPSFEDHESCRRSLRFRALAVRLISAVAAEDAGQKGGKSVRAKPRNYCTSCRRDFASLEAFDRHRVGAHGPGEFTGNPADWTYALGRRCLDSEELEAAGLRQDDRGPWFDAVKREANRERLAGLRRAA
jgi:hypothetical protein